MQKFRKYMYAATWELESQWSLPWGLCWGEYFLNFVIRNTLHPTSLPLLLLPLPSTFFNSSCKLLQSQIEVTRNDFSYLILWILLQQFRVWLWALRTFRFPAWWDRWCANLTSERFLLSVINSNLHLVCASAGYHGNMVIEQKSTEMLPWLHCYHTFSHSREM